MSKRIYSDEEKAGALACLAANGGNVFRTAKQLDVPEATLRAWSEGRNQHPCVSQMCEEKKATLAEKFEAFAHKALDVSLEDEEGLRKEKPLPRMLAAATAVDKHRLLTEQATTITEHRDDQLNRVIDNLLRLAHARGEECTREELIRRLAEYRPEVKRLLPPPH